MLTSCTYDQSSPLAHSPRPAGRGHRLRSTSTTPTDAPDGGEAGTTPPNQFGCPNGPPSAVDPAVCTAQKVSTTYNCPVEGPPSVCNVTFAYACGLPSGTGPFPVTSDAGLDATVDASGEDAAAPELRYDCVALCPGVPGPCSVSPPTDGGTQVNVLCGASVCGAGRRPEGYVASRAIETDPVVHLLGAMAELEAASIPAFARLRRELVALGAPNELVARVEQARRDEVRHARDVSAIARARGAAPSRVAPVPRAVRSPVAIAIENEREGSVRETFGTLLLAARAARASDPALRALFASIAEDEQRHADLSLDVGAWLDGRLDDDERSRVAAAREEAFAELRDELLSASTPCAITGDLAPHEAITLLDALATARMAA